MKKPRLEVRKETAIAYIEHRGPYDRIPWDDYIERLYSWAREEKVMPGFHPMGIYRDDPRSTRPEDCRSRVAITYKGEAREKGGIRTDHLPEMTVATLSHRGPSSEIGRSYDLLHEYMNESGRKMAGSPIEVYSKKPEVVDGKTVLYSKIMIPVK